MTEIERLEQENKMLRGKLDYLRTRCVLGADKYFDKMQGLIRIVPINADLTPKEQMELRNIRKRVETQRDEIRKLQETLSRQKEYAKNLESLCMKAVINNAKLEAEFRELIHTA